MSMKKWILRQFIKPLATRLAPCLRSRDRGALDQEGRRWTVGAGSVLPRSFRIQGSWRIFRQGFQRKLIPIAFLPFFYFSKFDTCFFLQKNEKVIYKLFFRIYFNSSQNMFWKRVKNTTKNIESLPKSKFFEQGYKISPI